jgi:hypothetical protein
LSEGLKKDPNYRNAGENADMKEEVRFFRKGNPSGRTSRLLTPGTMKKGGYGILKLRI